MRGVTCYSTKRHQKIIFLLTHLMRGVTITIANRRVYYNISTHTPHARCDLSFFAPCWGSKISTHTPHARCDDFRVMYAGYTFKFLLTHLMRGVTVHHKIRCLLQPISTHTPHARCDVINFLRCWRNLISTHTPHARCDFHPNRQKSEPYNFYSHTSCEV